MRQLDGDPTTPPAEQHLPVGRRAILASGLGLLFGFASRPTPVQAGEQNRWAEQMPLAPRSLLLDGVLRGDRIVAVGERGHVLVSVDHATTWTQAKVPTRALLTAVTMVGSDLAWAVGHGPVVLHSTDAGASWVRQHVPEVVREPLLDVWFENQRRGVAIGAYGRILTTEDAGDTWRAGLIDAREPHANALAQDSEEALYVAAEFGMLFRSVDHGRSWISLESSYGGSFFGVLAVGDGSLLAYGLRGHLIRSTDRGVSWATIEAGTEDSLVAGLSCHDGTVLLGGLRGTLLISRDSGRNFVMKRRPSRRAISAFLDLGPRGILLLGEGGFETVDDLNNLQA